MAEVDELGAQASMTALPVDIRTPAERALGAWRAGELEDAKAACDEALLAAQEDDNEFGVFHALHLRACVAFTEGDHVLARLLHSDVLIRSRRIGFLGGMASALCDLAMIDLAEGALDSARVRHARGVACYEDGGYEEHAEAARARWAAVAARA